MKIVYVQENGELAVVHPVEDVQKVLDNDVPPGIAVSLVQDEHLPESRQLRTAWVLREERVEVDVQKAKQFLHAKRRLVRDREFAPFDRMMTIPGKMLEAERGREEIRLRHEELQMRIEATEDVTALDALAGELRNLERQIG